MTPLAGFRYAEAVKPKVLLFRFFKKKKEILRRPAAE
jgi:hypothetical protein